MRILFVCRSNVARSQMGEAFYNHFTESRDGFSAGTAIGDFPAVTSDIRKVMNEAKVPLNGAYPKPVTPRMASVANKIILMTDFEVPDFLQTDPKVEAWDIPDPRFGTEKGLVIVRDQIRDLVQERLVGVSERS